MFWIVSTVILGFVFWGAIIFWAFTRKTPGNDAGLGLAVAACAAILWVLVSAGLSVHRVGQREVGVVYNFSGTISDNTARPGTPWTYPWQHIEKVNTGILHDEWVFQIDQDSAAVSKDQQQIGALLSVNYQIDSSKVVDLYDRVGANWKKIIIDARVPQVFKEVTATYATTDITANREKLRIDTKDRLKTELAKYDISVIDVFVKNLGFSSTYRDAIDRKQKQVQDALTAQAKVKQVEAEADQKIAQAKGEATANVERARGDATANRLRQRSLTKLLVQQLAIEKLNPNVQVVYCAPNVFCVPNAEIAPVGKP